MHAKFQPVASHGDPFRDILGPMGPLVPSTWYQVPSTWYQVLSTWYLVPSTWYQVLGAGTLCNWTKALAQLGPNGTQTGPLKGPRALEDNEPLWALMGLDLLCRAL